MGAGVPAIAGTAVVSPPVEVHAAKTRAAMAASSGNARFKGVYLSSCRWADFPRNRSGDPLPGLDHSIACGLTSRPRVRAGGTGAMAGYLALAARHGQEACFPPERIGETRALAAALLGCGADEVALLGPTSLGLSVVANGLDFPMGANVVCYRDDYPANVYP